MAQVDLKQIISRVASEKEKSTAKKVDLTQVLVFEVDQEEYAVNISVLREIISVPEVTPIPNAPDCIKGILNLRGQIVVVVDIEKRFHLTREHPQEAKHILITEVEGTYFGVTVDTVKEVLTVPVDNIRPAPELVSAKIHAEYVSGIIILGGEAEQRSSRLIVLLDLQKMLQEKELLQLGASIQTITNS